MTSDPSLAVRANAFPPAPSRAHALLLCGHPSATSLNDALGQAWAEGARAVGASVETLRLGELSFDLSRVGGFSPEADTSLEPDLRAVQAAIAKAAHLAIAYPVWWGGTPALLKGVFDRAFLPGWAFAYQEGSPIPARGLSGRSGRLLITMDAPAWYDRWVYGRSATRQVTHATLRFCGVKPVRVSTFHKILHSDAAARARMLEQARKAGRADGLRLIRRFSGTVEELAASV